MSIFTERDLFWMRKALQLAQYAAKCDEVPVGAVVVLNDEIIGEGWNQPIASCDPTAHAEIVALRAAAKKVENYRLIQATLYVTLEPCMMCAGAIVHARLKRLVYGAKDLKTGVVESQGEFLDASYLNHRVDYAGGLMSEDCGLLLSEFFQRKRDLKRIRS